MFKDLLTVDLCQTLRLRYSGGLFRKTSLVISNTDKEILQLYTLQTFSLSLVMIYHTLAD